MLIRLWLDSELENYYSPLDGVCKIGSDVPSRWTNASGLTDSPQPHQSVSIPSPSGDDYNKVGNTRCRINLPESKGSSQSRSRVCLHASICNELISLSSS